MKFFQLAKATEWRPEVAHGATVGSIIKIGQAPERGERNVWRSVWHLFFCRPVRGLDFLFAIQPTVTPWATFCRASGALAALVLFFAAAARAETTNSLSDAEIQGRQLAQQLCDAQPMENFTNSGVLQVRSETGKRFEIPVKIETILTATNWLNRYEAKFGSNITDIATLVVMHNGAESNRYLFFESDGKTELSVSFKFHVGMGVSGNRTMIPFASSDFWFADLGLEFLHWPAQKVLPKTTTLKRSREYTLLESTNPNPATNGYSRVLSWIDKESGGILEAEAYDTHGKLLKVFEPKSFKKVNGQWELQEMEIRNVQTGSRTRLEFDLKK